MRTLLFLLFINISVSFSQTLIPYYKNHKYGYCNLKKEIIIEPQFDGCGFFNDGLAWVQKGDKFGYIDIKGHIIVKPEFVIATNYKYGSAIVYDGDHFFVINNKGKQLNKKGFLHAIRVADSLVACDLGDEWNIINNKNKTIFHTSEEEGLEIYWQNTDYILVYDSSAISGIYMNLNTFKRQKETPQPKVVFSNPDSLYIVNDNKNNDSLKELYGIADKDKNLIAPKIFNTIIADVNMEFIFCSDRKTQTSQIYIAAKKHLSQPFRGNIMGIPFKNDDDSNDADGCQLIDGKYFFLCGYSSNKIEGQNICIDEDGNVYADY